MTSTPRISAAEQRDTAIPALRRRKRRRLDQRIARILCFVLALVGLLPFATTVGVRSTWARNWAARETARVLRSQGLVADYGIALRAWPLAVELKSVRVDSTDGGSPALLCDRLRVRPKLFALLAGKLTIDQVELDGPRARLVVKDGVVTNLNLPSSSASSRERPWPLHAPFDGLALTDASLDLSVDDTRLELGSLDLDVTSEDDPSVGSSFEVALRAGIAGLHRPRITSDGTTAADDDVLCTVDGRVRVEPTVILVRRLQGLAYADLDGRAGTTPACDLPADDKRRVEVSLGHLRIGFPRRGETLPTLDGHVHLRGPIALVERAANVPETDGWIGVDADLRYDQDMILPELRGTLEAHDVKLAQYAFAQELHSDVTIRGNVITSPKTTLRLADGLITMTDTVIDPLAKGARLERTTLDISGVDFTTLLRNLGVHPHSWVGWDIREVHAPLIAGTFAPLKLDGDFSAKTYTFGVYDRPAEDHARERLFGISDAQIVAHLGVRPDSIKFMDVHVALPHSRIDGALVSLGFRDELRVDAPQISVDLRDISPLGPVDMQGRLQASAHVGGTFRHPEPEGDIQTVAGFMVSDMAFGDIASGHVKVDVSKPEVEITAVKAKRRDSAYEVPTAVLRFGGANGFTVDAVGTSAGFGLGDFLSMFALDDDPRFDGLDAKLATRADVRVVLGGPEDACGSGYIAVGAKGTSRQREHLRRTLRARGRRARPPLA